MAGIIEMDNVRFSAQSGTIVENVSIEFQTSKTTALTGPSGCGKSTILKLAAGLLVPDEGAVSYKGKNIARMDRLENLEFRREGAFVFQDSALWANQNLYDGLELPLRIHYPEMDKKERERRIKAAVAEVGYKKGLQVRPSALSLGEQKLIAFARAMLCGPNLLFLDEWTESMDEANRLRLIELVKIRQCQGATVIFVNHDVRIIKDMADYIVLISEGHVSLIASKEQLMQDTELSNYLKTEIGA
ncbi:MAG: ATP-binding cassette domain-containing protein [Treponema sp.]|jgi:ABC-type transporter Mla maintaining outer membrane lipid asymmetry ATPase subunit MlaF|nr:ATP-binding cassette domain-containing protein [Treponema sp.]